MITAIKVLLVVLVGGFVLYLILIDALEHFEPEEDLLADQPIEILTDAEIERRFSEMRAGWHR